MRGTDIDVIVAGLAPVLKELLSVRDAKLAELQRRVVELEERAVALKYVGVWQRGGSYGLHNFVTHRGSLWACKVGLTTAEPGESNDWQLAAKRGADGRDAR